MVQPAFIVPAEKPVDDIYLQQRALIDAQLYQVARDIDQIMNQPPVAATGWLGIIAGATPDWGPEATVVATRYLGAGAIAVVANVQWMVEQPLDTTTPMHALQKIATAISQANPQVQVTVDPTLLRLNVVATTAGSAGNAIPLNVGPSYQSFIEASGTTLSGGKDGNVRQQLDAVVASTTQVMVASDRMLIHGRTDYKEVTQALGVYAPDIEQQAAERRMTIAGFPMLCGKPLIRDGKNRMAGAIDLVNLLGAGKAVEALHSHAPGSIIVVPVVTKLVSTPYVTSCGTIFRDEYHETVLPLDQGPHAVPAGATAVYYAYHIGTIVPTPTMVDRLLSVGFSYEQIGVMMYEGGDRLNVKVTKIADPTILDQVLTTASLDDLTEVSFRNIKDWVWNATAADWQKAVSAWVVDTLGSAGADLLKAFEYMNQTELWPFGDYLKTALDEVSNCLDQKLIDLFSWLVAKVEWFNDFIQKTLVDPVLKFANAAKGLIEFVKSLFQNFPGSVALCLLGDMVIELLPQLQDLFNLVMLTVTQFINTVMLTLTPLFAAMQLALQPICLINGVVTALLGHSVPGLECLPPLNIPVPPILIDLLNRLADFLKLIPRVIGILTDALAQILDALASLLNFSLKSSGPGSCNATSISAMLVALAAVLGGALLAGLLKDAGICQTPDATIPDEPATASSATTPKGWCPPGGTS
jgi:hypothetical protein